MEINKNLRTYNSFGFDVVAKEFIEIQDTRELVEIIKSGVLRNKKLLILSGGNNILFQDEVFDGVVIYMNNKGIDVIGEGDGMIEVKAQAGEDWPDFVKYCVERGWYGVENLAHIPGKVGAAPVQNIGAYGMELKDSFMRCEAIDLNTGEKRIFQNAECCFGYRESIFKRELRGRYIITAVDFSFKKAADLKLEYGNIRSYLDKNGIATLDLRQLHEAICEIRDAKLPDVKKIGNAGSFFKNPVIGREQFEKLQKEYRTIPHYPEADDRVKVPAGWLIEQSGWKGWRDEHVGVYEKQALVLVNYGGGTGKDILDLASRIQASVHEKFGISISMEVNVIQ